ncbi:MAG: putative glycolipid-binding domain-containing protein [Pseudomonadota bacterium]
MCAATILWRRLDTPGHDACRLVKNDHGWQLDGTAVFLHHGAPARLDYEVRCDPHWHTRQGRVCGWLGEQLVEYDITRTSEGNWLLNGTPLPQLAGCVDLDLGFTPATNLLPLRRLALEEGQAAEAPAAWLNVATGTLECLPQRYERHAETTYGYEAPSVGYKALLTVTWRGFIRLYPDLWEAEAEA